MTPAEFAEHLESASAVVATWPAWKRHCLGVTAEPTRENPVILPSEIESQILVCSWAEWLSGHTSFIWHPERRHIVQLSDEPILLRHPQGDATVYGFFNGGEPWLIYDKAWCERKDIITGLLKRQWPDVEFVWGKE